MMKVFRNTEQPGLDFDLHLLKKDTRYLFKYRVDFNLREFSVLEIFEEGEFKAIKVKGTAGEIEWIDFDYMKAMVSSIFIIGNIRKKDNRFYPDIQTNSYRG